VRSELHLKSGWTEQPNLLIATCQMAAPSEPQIEVETTRGVGKTPDNVQLAGDGVSPDLFPKPLAQFNAIR
jgi:hypothetical protein